ncbi:ABC transporter ATP-binding protein [Microbacterium album]|uniref:Peptide ABC transporter ATP-binding protein n=1 Tax=Microbacterium album TaxID=2053191 RepID=A0A917IEI5_9MICO|nr:ABC transporter ATP-binding protein [Microbacterium album]GGH40961.1 peptide ABC transporter ATP-binding protein [Microbacterium album]
MTAEAEETAVPLLEVRDLAVSLPTGVRTAVQAVNSVDLRVERGERVGIVGESGSGKSVTGRAVAGLLPTSPRVRVSGSIRFSGTEMVGAPDRAWDAVRARRVGMIFQDPLTYLNPVMKIGEQVRESVPPERRGTGDEEMLKFLDLAGLSDARAVAGRFPHELSGGMRQRVLIAIAIAKLPELIVADEPTTALDATVQRRVLATLDDTVSRLGTSLILISHDLAVVASMTDRIYVMYAGRIVESGPTQQVLSRPEHPYTRALLRSVRSLTDPDLELWAIRPSLRRELDQLVAGGARAQGGDQ